MSSLGSGASLEQCERSYHGARICCGKCPVHKAAMAVAILEILYLLYHIVSAVVIWFKGGSDYLPAFAVTLAFSLVSFVLIILLIMGIYGSVPGLLLPHLIAQVVAVIILSIMTILCIVLLAGSDPALLKIINVTDSDQDRYARYRVAPSFGRSDKRVPHSLTGRIVLSFLMFLAGALLEVWFFVIVLRCYQYLREKRAVRRRIGIPMTSVAAQRQRNSPSPAPYRVEYFDRR